jgi:hypothetical protein
MPTSMQQLPDGRWVPTEALSPQPGYDAEVTGHGPYAWVLYHDCFDEVARGAARTRLGAGLAIWWARWRDRKRRRP